MKRDTVYLLGGGWFGGVASIIGFNYLKWQFWLILLSYVVLGAILKRETDHA